MNSVNVSQYLEDTGPFEARYLAFLETSSALRPALHRYCARMTGSSCTTSSPSITWDIQHADTGLHEQWGEGLVRRRWEWRIMTSSGREVSRAATVVVSGSG